MNVKLSSDVLFLPHCTMTALAVYQGHKGRIAVCCVKMLDHLRYQEDLLTAQHSKRETFLNTVSP